MTATAIRAIGLRKSYGKQVVLDGIDIEVAEGSVFALLGPNGAGKTTTVHILTTLLTPEAGEVQIAGHDLRSAPESVRAAIGVTGQFSAVDNLLTGQENLQLMADLHHLGRSEGRRRMADLLDRFELANDATKVVATYSGGMKRRLDLAMTLMGDPRIVFLDEPTAGLDPRGRHTMWQVVRNLVAEGITILLTTQYLEEADELADRIALLDDGRIVATGTPTELKGRVPGGHIRLQFADAEHMARAASALGAAAGDPDGLALRVGTSAGDEVAALRSVLDRLSEGSVEVTGISLHTPDLDDVFLALTGTRTDAQVEHS